MKTTLLAAATLPFLAGPVWSQDTPEAAGDAEAGQTVFQRQCVACHVVEDESGNVIAGRNARVGPNLYGVYGAQPATVPDFNYSDDLVDYGETGATWETANLVDYLQGPTPFLREALDDESARGRMAYQLRSEEEAQDVAAFLAEHSQEMPADEEGEDAESRAEDGEGDETGTQGD